MSQSIIGIGFSSKKTSNIYGIKQSLWNSVLFSTYGFYDKSENELLKKIKANTIDTRLADTWVYKKFGF